MAYNRYDTLEVYKSSYALALEVHRLSLTFPKHETFVLADQIRRASRAIFSNIAEGFGRRSSTADERHFLSIALGSAEEMRTWLKFACDLGYIDSSQQSELNDKYEEICKMLFSLRQRRAQA